MTDERTEAILAAWLTSTSVAPPEARASARSVSVRLDGIPQRGHTRLPAPGFRWTAQRQRGSRMVGAVAFGTVAIALVLGVGLLAPGAAVLPDAVPGGSGSNVGAAAIHWRSGVVDLSAASFELRVGDETFTMVAADVVVDAYDGDTSQWALYPRWIEDGRNHWLYLSFESDGRSWRVQPWLWREGVLVTDELGWPDLDRIHDTMSDDDGTVVAWSVEFPGATIVRPLGEPYEDDWTASGTIEVPSCEPGVIEKVEVTMRFEDLRLSVTPREPSFLDTFLYDMLHRGSMLGDLVNGPLEPPGASPLDCD